MRYALTIRFYHANSFEKQFYCGKMMYFIEFRTQLERFCRTLEHKASQQDIDCVCGENVITKAKIFNFSEN